MTAHMQAVKNSYRDLKVWQQGIDLVSLVYRATKRFPDDERFGLTAQLRRAAVSVPANIAEGYGRRTRGEYLNSLSVSRGSLKEVETLCTIAKNLEMMHEDYARELDSRCEGISRMLWVMCKKLS